MSDDITRLELLRLRLTREGKPPSRAMETRYYGNPAQSVKFASERRRKDFELTHGRRRDDKL